MRGERPRIVFAGQGRWSRMLSEGLARHADMASEVAPFDSLRDATSAGSWRRVAAADVVVRVGFRPGATTLRGRIFDAAMATARLGRRSQQVCYWIGTDVRNAMDDLAAGRGVGRFRRLTAKARHLAGSAPLARDLAAIGIDAEIADFPLEGLPVTGELPGLPKRFTVLTYVPDSRPAFYGGPQIMLAARRLPGVRFLVMGGEGDWAEDAPANVVFLGWVKDPAAAISRSSCVVRMAEYDSIGGTVMEGLVLGRPVVYSRRMEHVTYAPFGDTDALVSAIAGLAERAGRGELGLDFETARWARRVFDPHARFLRLAALLGRSVEGGRA